MKKVLRWAVFFISFYFLVISASLGAFADEPYQSGPQLASENGDFVSAEKGFYVAVPVDYKNPSAGTTKIYAHFEKPFNPSLPTFVFLNGGPGQASHFPQEKNWKAYADLPYNFLEFDQRGILFSRPDREDLYRNLDFYSSENTARDLEEIRQFLKLDQLSVYGHSYGTVPATIYAHLFPKTTRSLILEGVVFDGVDKTSQTDPSIIHLIQRTLDGFPSEIKSAILQASDDYIIKPNWFPAVVKSFIDMYGEKKGVSLLTEDFQKAVNLAHDPAENLNFKGALNKVIADKAPSSDQERSPLMFYSDDFVFFVINAKENGFGREDMTTDLILEDGKIQKAPYNFFVNLLSEQGIPKNLPSTYSAKENPVKAPVYYFQGARDMRTVPLGAVKHWRSVPKGSSYLMIMPDGQHMPTSHIYERNFSDGTLSPQGKFFFESVFLKALNGSSISKQDIDTFNRLGTERLAFVAKTPKPLSCRAIFQF